jgi:hypothetical protein
MGDVFQLVAGQGWLADRDNATPRRAAEAWDGMHRDLEFRLRAGDDGSQITEFFQG